MEREILKIAHILTTNWAFIFNTRFTNTDRLWVDKELYLINKDIQAFLKEYKEEVALLLNGKIDYILIEYDTEEGIL